MTCAAGRCYLKPDGEISSGSHQDVFSVMRGDVSTGGHFFTVPGGGAADCKVAPPGHGDICIWRAFPDR